MEVLLIFHGLEDFFVRLPGLLCHLFLEGTPCRFVFLFGLLFPHVGHAVVVFLELLLCFISYLLWVLSCRCTPAPLGYGLVPLAVLGEFQCFSGRV